LTGPEDELTFKAAERLTTQELVDVLVTSSQQNTDLDMCDARHAIMGRNIAEDVIEYLLTQGWTPPGELSDELRGLVERWSRAGAGESLDHRIRATVQGCAKDLLQLLGMCGDPSVTGGCRRPKAHSGGGHSMYPILDDPGATPIEELVRQLADGAAAMGMSATVVGPGGVTTSTGQHCPSLYLRPLGRRLYQCNVMEHRQTGSGPDGDVWHKHTGEDGTVPWTSEMAVPSPWPKDQEPPAGINVLRDLGAIKPLDASGGRYLIRGSLMDNRVPDHWWCWTDSPDGHGAAYNRGPDWPVCAEQAHGDLVVQS
jgi:hypothetical protein